MTQQNSQAQSFLQKVLNIFNSLFDGVIESRQRRAQEYLAKSADLVDLEKRMKELDRGKFYI